MYSCLGTTRVVGSPIRISADQCLFTTPRSFSQCITSFFASDCQGIHQMPLLRLILLRINNLTIIYTLSVKSTRFISLYIKRYIILSPLDITLILLSYLLYAITWIAPTILIRNSLVPPINGGGKEDRTPDPLLAKQVLSQLSYTPMPTSFGRSPATQVPWVSTLASAAVACLTRQDSQDVTDKINKPLLILLSHPS